MGFNLVLLHANRLQPALLAPLNAFVCFFFPFAQRTTRIPIAHPLIYPY